MKRVIVDTGPLVALLNARDAHHAWTREVLDRVEPPLVTCEAVLSEACFLVRNLELDARATVLTLDSDFKIYRRNGRHVIATISPK